MSTKVVPHFVQRLIEIGRSEKFALLAEMSQAKDKRTVVSVLSARVFSAADQLVRSLSDEDLVALIKAVVMAEDRVGGVGSVSPVVILLRQRSDPELKLFDWILENTEHYYYAHGPGSLEHDGILSLKASERKQEVEAAEQARSDVARERRAVRATGNLPNAVRRKDVKAVRALIAQGADPNVEMPDGKRVISYAIEAGLEDIAQVLSGTEPAADH
jgi:hypothetical protein